MRHVTLSPAPHSLPRSRWVTPQPLVEVMGEWVVLHIRHLLILFLLTLHLLYVCRCRYLYLYLFSRHYAHHLEGKVGLQEQRRECGREAWMKVL